MSAVQSTKISRVCAQCGKTFMTPASEVRRGGGVFCSKGCYHANHNKTSLPCSFTGCDRLVFSKGLCKPHYKQQYRGEELRPIWVTNRSERVCPTCQKTFVVYPYQTKQGRGVFCSKECHTESMVEPLAERFWRFVNKTETCWLWTGAHSNYGLLNERGRTKTLIASRVSWEIHNGPIPDGLYVLHDCPGGDNPLCVNPAHLWLGTAADNSHDMMAKGRNADRSGEHNGQAKLTWEKVNLIRAKFDNDGVSVKELASEFQVHQQTISDVVRRRNWNPQT